MEQAQRKAMPEGSTGPFTERGKVFFCGVIAAYMVDIFWTAVQHELWWVAAGSGVIACLTIQFGGWGRDV